MTINIPSLKERREDISQLIKHFTHVFNHKHGTNVSFAKETFDIMMNYSWPGNIRELEHLIEFLILNSDDSHISPYMLPTNMLDPELRHRDTIFYAEDSESDTENTAATYASTDYKDFESLEAYTDFYEGNFIRDLYKTYSSSYKLAERLKISQSKASRLIKKYHLKT